MHCLCICYCVDNCDVAASISDLQFMLMTLCTAGYTVNLSLTFDYPNLISSSLNPSGHVPHLKKFPEDISV